MKYIITVMLTMLSCIAYATPQSSSVSSITDEFKYLWIRPIPEYTRVSYCRTRGAMEVEQGSLIPGSWKCRVINYYDLDNKWVGVLLVPKGKYPFRVPWVPPGWED